MTDNRPVTTRVMNLAHFLTQAARRHGAEVGFVWGDRTWTWGEMERRVDAMASALLHRGVAKGDRVLVQSKNCNQMFESMFACFRIGAVWVPANYRQTPDEVAWLAKAGGAAAMICHAAFPEHAAACRAAQPSLRSVVSIGPSDFGDDYDALVAQHDGEKPAEAAVDRDDPCWFFFTSGTTGRPKAAVLTHGQMAFVVTNHLCDLMPGTTEADASLARGDSRGALHGVPLAHKDMYYDAGKVVTCGSLIRRDFVPKTTTPDRRRVAGNSGGSRSTAAAIARRCIAGAKVTEMWGRWCCGGKPRCASAA